jgi:Flp pilus assembly protein TadG
VKFTEVRGGPFVKHIPADDHRQSLAQRLRNETAQAAVELTVGFLLFLTMFMAIVEFSHFIYTKVTLQNALRNAGRYMVTGNTGLNKQGNPIPRDQMIHDVFCANMIATGLQCPSLGADFQFTCVGSPCTAPGGGPEQTVMVTVNLNKPALTPFGSQFFPSGGIPIQISTTWKNEPFPTD